MIVGVRPRGRWGQRASITGVVVGVIAGGARGGGVGDAAARSIGRGVRVCGWQSRLPRLMGLNNDGRVEDWRPDMDVAVG